VRQLPVEPGWGRAVLGNPRYTGRQVWNRQRKDEVLLDVHDVALGHTTKQRWNQRADWIWSEQTVHEPLIDTATFEQAQVLRRAQVAHAQRAPRRTPRPYTLRGLLYCGICDRRMQGSWNNDAAYYRCVFLSQYAAKNKIDHPRAVYLREDQLLPSLDHWLGRLFRSDALPRTARELEEAQDAVVIDAAVEQARREIADCDAKLRQHRAALEAGADPAIVTGWMAETQARGTAAETRMRPGPQRRRISHEEITRCLAAMRDVTSALADAPPADKATLYGQLGLSLTYHPEAKRLNVTARPLSNMYVRKCPRGDLNTQMREISPVRGNHGTRVTGTGPACPGIRRGVRCSFRCLACLMARAAAAGGSARAPLTTVVAASGSGALCGCPSTSHGTPLCQEGGCSRLASVRRSSPPSSKGRLTAGCGPA
jgi:site-specific DNA recombinase